MSSATEIVTTIALLASSVLMIAVAATWFSDGRRKRPRSRKLEPLLQPQRPDEDRPPAEQGITWPTAAYVVSAGLVGFAVGAVVGELPLRLFAGSLVIGVLVPVLGGLCAQGTPDPADGRATKLRPGTAEGCVRARSSEGSGRAQAPAPRATSCGGVPENIHATMLNGRHGRTMTSARNAPSRSSAPVAASRPGTVSSARSSPSRSRRTRSQRSASSMT